MDNYFYFHEHLDISVTNNAAERVSIKVKMHIKQSGGFRNRTYDHYYCNVLSVIESQICDEKSRHKIIYDVFSR